METDIPIKMPFASNSKMSKIPELDSGGKYTELLPINATNIKSYRKRFEL